MASLGPIDFSSNPLLSEDDPQFAECMKIYNDNGGDLAAIAAAMGGVSFKDGVSVSDAKDFAQKLLSGKLLAD